MAYAVDEEDAKAYLSRLIDCVERGEAIVIARSRTPIARLGPYRRQRGPRTPGGWEGRVTVAEDFDSLLEEVAAAFRGRRS